MAEGRYVLVYHEDLIANFAEVWDDDRVLATWLRLLANADKLWPSPAELPRGAKPSIVKQLVSVELIELLPNHRYKVRGLDAQRQRRSDVARNAASNRWSNAESNASHGRASGSGHGNEPTGEEGVQGETGADALDAFYRLTTSWPSQKILPWLNQLVDDHGDAAVSDALGTEWELDSNRATFLGRVRDRLEREAHEARKRHEVAERQRLEEERRRIESMPPEQRAANMQRFAEMMKAAGLDIGKPMPS